MVLIIMGIMTVGVIGFVAIMLMESNKKVGNTDKRGDEKKYEFFSENFLTRGSFRRLVEQVASLSVYDVVEVRALSVKYYMQSVGICIACLIAAIFIFKDVIAFLLCLMFVLVAYNTLITRKLDKVHMEVLKEFSSVLSSIRETYTLMGNIPDAIGECTRGKLLHKPLDRIYLILTATDAEARLEEFYRTVPFPMLQTLAGVCYLLNDAGDETNDSGVSAFKSAITLLKHECDLEVRKLTNQHLKYQNLQILPIAPLAATGVIEWFFVKFMPGTATIYNGIIGYISQVCVILVALFAYWYITNATSDSTIRRSDRSRWVDTALGWRPFRNIVDNIVPKSAKVRMKWDNLLRGALSAKDLRYIYASKIIAAALAFVLTLTALLTFTYTAKEFAYNNIKMTTLVGGGDMTVDEAARWMELDSSILAQPKAPRERDLLEIIPSYFSDLSAMDLKDHCNRIISKYNTYHSLRFHWWYILVAYGVSTIAWFAPSYMIKNRKKLVRASEEEDVLQLQTMLAILRYTSLDTMEALYWLGRQSRIYQTAIYFAYHEYPSDPELAINRLRDKSNLPEFQQICERLLTTISQITIREAFADLEAERDQLLSIRQMVQNNAIEKKRRRCSPISKAPLYTLIVGHVLLPIGVLVLNEGKNLLTQLGV